VTERAIFGDFQTPPRLAEAFVRFVAREFPSAGAILEPTVGGGAILAAALEAYPGARGLGVDRDEAHLGRARASLARFADRIELVNADMFAFDYGARIASMPEPLAILGNPPWVTNAAMPTLGGANLPTKSNRAKLRGLEARTGRSNFDVAEWLIAELVVAAEGRDAVVAFLVKSQVARRLVRWASDVDAPMFDGRLATIDSAKWFGASVDACAFAFRTRSATRCRDVRCFDALDAEAPSRTMGLRGGVLLKRVDVAGADEILGVAANRAFRSGVKHDASKVFELVRDGDVLRNGFGELVDVEAAVRFPLVKGGDLGRASAALRELVLPQSSLADRLEGFAATSPRAARYLESHGGRLDARKSSIYRDRPRFSVFGIGPYSFAPYKVAVFGLAKTPLFEVVGPRDGRPTMLDDTAYFVPCADEASATALARALSSSVARALFENLVFPDSKRPITKDLLSRVDLRALAERAHALGELSRDELECVLRLARSLALAPITTASASGSARRSRAGASTDTSASDGSPRRAPRSARP